MKKTLTLLAFICFYGLLYAQKNGYKQIQIGKNVLDVINKNEYLYKVDSTKKHYYIVPDTAFICGRSVDYIWVDVDNNNLINEIRLYTKRVIYEDHETWFNVFKGVIDVLDKNVGKMNYTNIGKGEMKWLCAWEFPETKTMLSVRVDDSGTFEKNFERGYLFIWDKADSAGKGNTIW